MRQIALALRQYEEVHGCFPPAHVDDDRGRPLHSWRILLLPFLHEKQLYDKYDFNEPWNGPNNSRLSALMPDCYMCPESSTRPGLPLTAYVAVVGPGTVWLGNTSIQGNATVDRATSTILFVESSAAPVLWMAPRDMDILHVPLQINSKADAGISSTHPPGGAHVACVDGSVVFLREKTCSPQQLRAMLTIVSRKISSTR
jgi:hypothetical protein